MSVQAIAWVLEQSEARGAHRCVLISIANHVTPEGSGWVHVRRVCAEARCSPGTYARAVEEAIGRGELIREVHAGGSARMHDAHRPNLFTFPALAGDAARPLERNLGGNAGKPAPVSPVADRVFAAWLVATDRDPARTRLTAQRRKKIDARLREGYSEDELTAAVRGIARSAFHTGDNDAKTRYDDLTVALRDGGQVERFAALWEHRETSDRPPATGRRRGCPKCDNGFVMHDDGTVSVCDCPEASGDDL